MRFLCIGECMQELAPAGDNIFRAGFAGDTFNTAWYARRLAGPEVEVAYLSAVGTDDASQRLEKFVSDAGIIPEFAHRPDRSIGLYMISVSNGERSFSYWRSTSAARTLADDFDTLPGLAPGDLVYFSGITLAILEPDARVRLLGAISKARALGVTIAFDPNLRPRLWTDIETMRQVVMAGAAVADIALPSFEDEAEHFGDVDPAACAHRYANAGAATVAVKDGERPVCLLHAGKIERIPTEPAAKVVDSTAAGDSFNAAFLMELSQGRQLPDAVRAGCSLSAKVIGQSGALIAI